MGRHIYIIKAKKLSFSNNSIIICKEEDRTLIIPLEDLDLIFIEDPNSIITASLITEAAKKGVGIVFCGKDYLPTAQTIPINIHYEKSAHLKAQINLLPYKKKKLWEAIVKAKIKNQINVISALIDDITCINRLNNYLENVKPGDELNMEGTAARVYFSTLFGSDFIRFSENPISKALNYGYSIIASAVIRQVSYAGLEDNLGIWHNAEKNANNLSYDFIEPFRQIVDYFVYNHRNEINYPLEHEIKVAMVNLLKTEVLMNNKRCKLNYAIELTINSFVEYLNTGNIQSIILPSYRPSYYDESDEYIE